MDISSVDCQNIVVVWEDKESTGPVLSSKFATRARFYMWGVERPVTSRRYRLSVPYRIQCKQASNVATSSFITRILCFMPSNLPEMLFPSTNTSIWISSRLPFHPSCTCSPAPGPTMSVEITACSTSSQTPPPHLGLNSLIIRNRMVGSLIDSKIDIKLALADTR